MGQSQDSALQNGTAKAPPPVSIAGYAWKGRQGIITFSIIF